MKNIRECERVACQVLILGQSRVHDVQSLHSLLGVLGDDGLIGSLPPNMNEDALSDDSADLRRDGSLLE